MAEGESCYYMIKIKDKTNCTGCYACYNICPNGCLQMVQDNEGFWYPGITENNCINCGLCIKVCPVIKTLDKENASSRFAKKIYAAKNVDDTIRLDSSSGGVFSVLAENVINNNGIVIGATFNDKFEVVHEIVQNIKDLGKIRGSKYVQSKIGNIYKKVKLNLKNQKLVLFTGTPCQIAGLKSYLHVEYDNLITQDIICHGVPSPEVWKKYIIYVNNYNKYGIKSINFRSKTENWRLFSLLFTFKNDKFIAKNIEEDFYLIAFQNNIDLRSSCYNCKFKGENRNSDLTLADFWGIENTHIKLDDNKGTSLIFINSLKGNMLFRKVNKYLEVVETDIITATKNNKNYYVSATKNSLREKFLAEVTEENFESKVREYCNYSYTVELKKKTKKRLKIILNYLGLIKIVKLVMK